MADEQDHSDQIGSEAFARLATPADVSLGIDVNTSFEEWAEIGRTLGRITRSSRWWVGDWCLFGESAYGEKYSQEIEVTGYDYQTLANAAWVSRRIAPMTRLPPTILSWSHHAEVARFETAGEQAEWLEKARAAGWTRDQLRDAIRAALKDPAEASGPAETEDAPMAARTVLRRIFYEALTRWSEDHVPNIVADDAVGWGALGNSDVRDKAYHDLVTRVLEASDREGFKLPKPRKVKA